MTALLCTVLTGCGDPEGGGRAAATVRDSAGVEIVENRDPAWSDDARWTVDSAPILSIGEEDGDPQLEFFRVWSIARLSDGRIVVANAGTDELRYFSAGGEYVCSAGRRGHGPGEFENLAWIQALPGDSLAAYQFGAGGRLSTFDAEGRFVSSQPRPQLPDVRFAIPLLVLPNGKTLLRSGRAFTPGASSGTYRDTALVAIAGVDTVHATLGWFPGGESVVVGSANSVSVTSLPYSRNVLVAADDSVIYVGVNETYELRVYGMGGDLVRIIRLDQPPLPVTSEDVTRADSTRIANATTDDQRQRARTWIAQMRYPPTMPAFSRLHVDPDRNLWVADYQPEPGPETWKVFDSGGRLLGDVRFPEGFAPRHFSRTEVIGVTTSDLGVEMIGALRIEKPSLPRSPTTPGVTPGSDRRGAPTGYVACGVRSDSVN